MTQQFTHSRHEPLASKSLRRHPSLRIHFAAFSLESLHRSSTAAPPWTDQIILTPRNRKFETIKWMGPRRTAEETGKQDQLWHTAAKMDERTMTSYEVQKAIESERDNKFARRRTPPDRARQRHLMPEVLQVEDESRPATTSSGPAPSSGNPTPMDRPFAGMRELGQLPMGANKMLKTGPLSRRVSITENIQKLGESPTSPSSPASPTTMRSPLRFFRAREDKRDQNFVAAATSSEAKPAVVLRERVRSEAIEKMDRVCVSPLAPPLSCMYVMVSISCK